MHIVSSILWGIVGYMLVTGLIVTVHEWGHFAMARLFGIDIEAFSIGFFTPLYRRRLMSGAELRFCAVPLGGYVKFREASGPGDKNPALFEHQHPRRKIAVSLAGPGINLVVAILVLTAVYMVGLPSYSARISAPPASSPASRAGLHDGDLITGIDRRNIDSWGDLLRKVMIAAMADQAVPIEYRSVDGQVHTGVLDMRNTAQDPLWVIQRSGLQRQSSPQAPILQATLPNYPSVGVLEPGDELMAANGQALTTVADWIYWISEHPGQSLQITFRRGEVIKVANLTIARRGPSGHFGKLGIVFAMPTTLPSAGSQFTLRYGPIQSFTAATDMLADVTRLTGLSLYLIATRKAELQNLSGPIAIADQSGKSVQMVVNEGLFIQFFVFIGLINIAIALVNLIPLLVLDGGQTLLFAYEWVRGRAVSKKIVQSVAAASYGLLGFVIVLCFYTDITRLLNS